MLADVATTGGSERQVQPPGRGRAGWAEESRVDGGSAMLVVCLLVLALTLGAGIPGARGQGQGKAGLLPTVQSPTRIVCPV